MKKTRHKYLNKKESLGNAASFLSRLFGSLINEHRENFRNSACFLPFLSTVCEIIWWKKKKKEEEEKKYLLVQTGVH